VGSVKPRTSPVSWIISGVLLIVAVLFFVLWVCLAPVYVGASGTTTGTIVSSPTSHPVISYAVDGTQYQLKSLTNMPSWTLGQEVTVMYNPRNPAQANDYVGHGFALAEQFLALAFAVAAIGTGIGAYRKLEEARWPVEHGERVEAKITDVTRTYLHQGPKGATVLGRVTCEWTSPDGTTHQFRTAGRKVPENFSLNDVPVTTLPVYIDPSRPEKRYFVDDSELPGEVGRWASNQFHPSVA